MPFADQPRSLSAMFLATNRYVGDENTTSQDTVHSIRRKRLKILLVDDRDDFRESMSFILTEKYETDVKHVASGREAVALLKTEGVFDIVFLDLMMPGMSGLDTYHELRKVDDSCRVVMMSAYQDSDEWIEAEKLDVELVQKPIPTDKLTSILNK